MALWQWNGVEYLKAPWHSVSKGNLKAMLYGTGESLKDADLSAEGYMRFGINYVYKKLEPHVFIGMDEPKKFGKELMEKPFRKVFRGNFALDKVDGIAARDYPETYFADVQSDAQSSIFFQRGIDTSFYFSKKSMFVALHLILYMGFKDITFSGVDLGGEYFYNQKLTEYEQKTLDEEFEFMKWFTATCPVNGITLKNTSKTSRLNEIIKEQ